MNGERPQQGHDTKNPAHRPEENTNGNNQDESENERFGHDVANYAVRCMFIATSLKFFSEKLRLSALFGKNLVKEIC